MARIPQVTRTITVTNARVLCIDVQKKEPFEIDVKLPRTYAKYKKLFEAVQNAVNKDNVKAVDVISTNVEKILYGMTEAEFITHAKIMEKR